MFTAAFWRHILSELPHWFKALLIGHLHLDLPFMLGGHVQKTKFESHEAKHIPREFIIAYSVISVIIILAAWKFIPWIGHHMIDLEKNNIRIGKWWINVPLTSLFLADIWLAFKVIRSWQGAKMVKVDDGNVGMHSLFSKWLSYRYPGDMEVLAIPGIIELHQNRKIWMVEVSLDGSYLPKVLSANKGSATYDLQVERDKHENDILNKNNVLVKVTRAIIFLELTDVSLFRKNFRSEAEAEYAIQSLFATAIRETGGKKGGSQWNGSLDVVRKRIQIISRRALGNLSEYFTVKEIATPGVEIEAESLPEKVEMVFSEKGDKVTFTGKGKTLSGVLTKGIMVELDLPSKKGESSAKKPEEKKKGT